MAKGYNSNDWYYDLDLKNVCENCGMTGGSHHAVSAGCPDPITHVGSNTLDTPYGTYTWAGITYGKNGSQSKQSSVPKVSPTVKTPLTKKDYGDQCPCGLHPSQCDYHKA